MAFAKKLKPIMSNDAGPTYGNRQYGNARLHTRPTGNDYGQNDGGEKDPSISNPEPNNVDPTAALRPKMGRNLSKGVLGIAKKYDTATNSFRNI